MCQINSEPYAGDTVPFAAAAASCRSEGHVVMGMPGLSRSSGKIDFELEVVSAAGELAAGIAGTNFRGDYVGADGTSWGLWSFGCGMHE